MEFGVFQGASVGPRPWDETEPQRIRDIGIDQLVFIPLIGWGHELNEKSLESIRQAEKHVLPVARKAS